MLPATGAKLLDFGLAKPAVPLVSGANLAGATQTTPMTEEGTIVGHSVHVARASRRQRLRRPQ